MIKAETVRKNIGQKTPKYSSQPQQEWPGPTGVAKREVSVTAKMAYRPGSIERAILEKRITERSHAVSGNIRSTRSECGEARKNRLSHRAAVPCRWLTSSPHEDRAQHLPGISSPPPK